MTELWTNLIDLRQAVDNAEDLPDAEFDKLSDERLDAQHAVTATGSAAAAVLAGLIARGEDVTLAMLEVLRDLDAAV